MARREIDEKTILIYANTPEKLREHQALVLRVFYLAHAEAKNTAAFLRAMLKVKDLFIDERANFIAVRDTAEMIVLTEKLPPSNLTVFEIIALGRQPYTNWLGNLSDNDISKINEAMELTQITSFADKKHYEISDGQLQNVLVARALAQDTPLIILDEPTTHLDLLHKVSLFKLLKKLAKETNKCILFSTHDIDMAIQISDEMIIMTNENVAQDQPCNFISKGDFNTLFKDEHIAFDSEKGKFVVQ